MLQRAMLIGVDLGPNLSITGSHDHGPGCSIGLNPADLSLMPGMCKGPYRRAFCHYRHSFHMPVKRTISNI